MLFFQITQNQLPKSSAQQCFFRTFQFSPLQRIQFVSELPKTATGKVQKYVLRGKPAISKQ